MLSTLFTIVIIVTPFLLLLSYIPGLSVAPFVPTMQKDVQRMVALAEIKPGDKIYDLGSGDGRLLIEAHRYSTDLIGLEVSPVVYLICKINLWLHRVKVNLILTNLFSYNFSQADVIFFFLMPQVLPALKEKIAKECKKGCRIVSYSFSIPEWQEIKVDWPEKRLPIYLYRVE